MAARLEVILFLIRDLFKSLQTGESSRHFKQILSSESRTEQNSLASMRRNVLRDVKSTSDNRMVQHKLSHLNTQPLITMLYSKILTHSES